MNIMSTTSA